MKPGIEALSYSVKPEFWKNNPIHQPARFAPKRIGVDLPEEQIPDFMEEHAIAIAGAWEKNDTVHGQTLGFATYKRVAQDVGKLHNMQVFKRALEWSHSANPVIKKKGELIVIHHIANSVISAITHFQVTNPDVPIDADELMDRGLERAARYLTRVEDTEDSLTTEGIQTRLNRDVQNAGKQQLGEQFGLPFPFIDKNLHRDILRYVEDYRAKREHHGLPADEEIMTHFKTQDDLEHKAVVMRILEQIQSQSIHTNRAPTGASASRVADAQEDIEEHGEEHERRQLINEVLSSLKPRERTILELRYGLIDGVERPLRQVGAVLRISGSAVWLVQQTAEAKLRHPHLTKKLKVYR